jgi:CheY-like chemotaxis protein
LIAVVDDHQDACESVAAILERAGPTVLTAGSARDAIRIVSTSCPSVLVSDIEMPGEDGLSLVRALRSALDLRLQQMPAIALTAQARWTSRRNALAAGFSLYVAKPVEPTELVLVIAGALGIGATNRAPRTGIEPV